MLYSINPVPSEDEVRIYIYSYHPYAVSIYICFTLSVALTAQKWQSVFCNCN